VTKAGAVVMVKVVTVMTVMVVMVVTVTLFPSPPQSVKRGRW